MRSPTRVRTLLLLTAIAVGLAWFGTTTTGYRATTPLGYWLGVAGGIAMLVVFLYPMRKRFSFMRSWGAAKYWFSVHMVCGIAGPLVVLIHTGFQVGSVNAGVALSCTLLVAASGIVGRFVYVRIHHGLSGAHWTLAELNTLIGTSDAQVRSRLAFAPHLEQRLHEFQSQVMRPKSGIGARVWSFLAVAPKARLVGYRARRELQIALKARRAAVGWDESQYRRALAKADRLIGDYLEAVQRAAQLSTYERMFSWWHILHVPLVWLLVVSAVAHVVAVHAY